MRMIAMIEKCKRCENSNQCPDNTLDERLLCQAYKGTYTNTRLPKYANIGVPMNQWNVNMVVK